jgi:hypothetical protein
VWVFAGALFRPLSPPNLGGKERYAFSLPEISLNSAGDKTFLFQRLAFSLSASWRVSLESQCKGTKISAHLQIFGRFERKSTIFVLKIQHFSYSALFLAPIHFDVVLVVLSLTVISQDVINVLECVKNGTIYIKMYFYIIVSKMTNSEFLMT